jgi:hypothetical protein
MRRAIEIIRRVALGDPRRLARVAQRAEWLRGEPELRRFASDLRIADGQPGIVFGHVRFRSGRRQTVGLEAKRVLGTHSAFSGASRSGKTTLALDVVDQVLRFSDVRLLAIDPKGDFEQALREERLPLLAVSLGETFARRVRYLRPFAGGVAPLRLTAREPGVSLEVQSLSLATALAEASGMALSPPAIHAFAKLARLAVELDEPLTVLPSWMARPDEFARTARRSESDELRHYAAVEFAREHRGVLRALRTRVEGVLWLPSVRAAVESPTCVSFARSLEDHHLVIDLSNPPAGEEAAVKILGGPIVGRVARAALSRQVRGDSPHVLCAIDELQELLTHYEEGSFCRLAALALARRFSLLTINQQRVQLGPKLSEVLRTNCGIEAIFRCHAQDAEALSHILPVSGRAERPSDERRTLVRRMVSLKQRQFLWWLKDGAVPAHFTWARKVDRMAMRRAIAEVPDQFRASLGRWTEESTAVAHSSRPVAPRRQSPVSKTGTEERDSPYPELG